ncbi:MAG: hypothetical protein Q4A16_03955 [Lautropia sp.]|nr:hypothetical protein [Lautropia sp.]
MKGKTVSAASAKKQGLKRLVAWTAGVAVVGLLTGALIHAAQDEASVDPAPPEAAEADAAHTDVMRLAATDAEASAEGGADSGAAALKKKGIRVPEDSPAARDPVPSPAPIKPHESLCISADDLLEFQSRSDGFINGVNPEWTWSHAAWSGSAKPYYAGQPDWVKEQFEWLRDIPEDKWTLLMPWYVVGTFDGEKEHAQAEIGEMSVQYYSKSQKRWVPMAADMAAVGGIFEKGATGSGKPKAETGQVVELPPGDFAHGWFNFVNLPQDLKDLQAVSIAVRVRSKNGTLLLVETGADYYPSDWRERLGNGPLMPGLGTSAPRAVGKDWKTIVFTTLNTQTNDGTGISPEDLRKQRPHCP